MKGFAAAAVAALALALAPTADAAVEFGSNCTAREVEPGLTLLNIDQSAAEPLPAAAPISGVITQGKTSFTLLSASKVAVALHVYRRVGAFRFTLVGESGQVPVTPGANAFATRIPVREGDRLGFSNSYQGESVGLACRTEDPGDFLAYTDEPPPLGGTATFGTATGYRAPIAAVIEPDADNDGYGDETQDGCPQSAAFQTACPVIELDASATAGRKAVVVKIGASSEGPVSVKGVAGLGKGRKATLKAGPKVISAGTTASFRLKFNAKLKKRLQELEPSRKLTLKITASATNVAGQISTDRLKVKLKGQDQST